MAHCHSFPPLEVPKDGPKILCTGRHRVGDVVSMRVMFLRLGMRLQAISFDHPVRISRHLLLNIFRTPTLFTHALVPSVFRLEVSVMIQESSSKFFPTGLGIRQPRPATHRTPLTGDRAQDPLAETNPGAPRRLGIRDRSFARGSFSSRFNPRRGGNLVPEQFTHLPDMIGQAAGHGGSTSHSPLLGFAQLMMGTTEIVGASDQIHPRLKCSEATGRMT